MFEEVSNGLLYYYSSSSNLISLCLSVMVFPYFPYLTEISGFRSCSRDVITNNSIIYSSHKLVLKCFCDEQKPLTDQFITEMFLSAELEVVHLPLYVNNIWNLFAVKRIWKPIKIFYFFSFLPCFYSWLVFSYRVYILQ